MLSKEIATLIGLRREGDYWDFKKLPHSNNSDLLHDIVCLANSPTRHMKYLIIGVSDPSQGCHIEGLSENTPHRKRQSDFLDFLRDKKFAGDVRPSVSLSTFHFDGKEVDVLSIEDTESKPYYLTETGFGLHAFHIYTRIGDTNTPKNSSADLYYTEKLWQQRFGLDLSPIERFELLLGQPEMWNIDVGNKEYSHHKISPEYQLRFCQTRQGWEPYSHYFPNPTTFFGDLQLMYFSTVLMEMGYCGLDEFRIPTVTPKVEVLRIENVEWFYYFFETDSIEWKVNKLLGLHWMTYLNIACWPFVVFRDQDERIKFNDHLVKEGSRFLESPSDDHDVQIAKRIERDGKGGGIGATYIGKTNRELINWRNWRDAE